MIDRVEVVTDLCAAGGRRTATERPRPHDTQTAYHQTWLGAECVYN